MENKKEKNKEEELKTIKTKYKKLKLAILLVIIIIVISFIFNLLYTSIVTQKIFKSNTSIDIGDNYKATYLYDGKVNRIVYYKDNKVKTVHLSGDVGMIFVNDKQYLVNFAKKQYMELENNGVNISNVETNLIQHIAIDEQYVNSLGNIIKIVLADNVKLRTEKDKNQKEYLALEIKNSGIKLLVNKENYLVEKEISNGSTQEIKIEKDVVVDEDVLSPEELGYTKVSTENFK